MSSPNIYIVGAGAIGKALAVLLAEAGRSVALVRASTDSVPNAFETITVNTRDFSATKTIRITSLHDLSIINGIVVIATKAHSNRVVAGKLSARQGDFSVVVMQNGLNVEQPFAHLGDVYRCVLFSTSQILDDGIVSFKAVSPSPIGSINGSTEGLANVVRALHTPVFEFRPEADIARFAWEKTIINCAFNSLCPLLETDNGIFHRNEQALAIARTIVGEGALLASEYGVQIDEKAILERLLLISQRSDGQLISTYEDLRNKRPTEIESLNLEMERLAQEISMPHIVRLTAALGRMILLKSSGVR